MKLDPTYLQYITKDELRVLTAIEMGMRNHEYVPIHLVERISHLKRANSFKILQQLLKNKLVVKESQKYIGYKLTYLGYDYLALHTFMKRGHLKTVLGKLGVGKESDIYKCVSNDNEIIVLKLARLGRTSFRTIKKNRDYLQNRTNYNWLYLSRLASLKEFSFMDILYKNEFPTPRPIDSNRHGILMSHIDGHPLCTVREMEDPQTVYLQCANLVWKFAKFGLIHSDFNEFNILVNQKHEITVIDFPQMVSITHKNADFYFQRDLFCIQNFFEKRFSLKIEQIATPDNNLGTETNRCIEEETEEKNVKIMKIEQWVDKKGILNYYCKQEGFLTKRLDIEVKASGFLTGELENNLKELEILDDFENFKEENNESNSDDDQNDKNENFEEKDNNSNHEIEKEEIEESKSENENSESESDDHENTENIQKEEIENENKDKIDKEFIKQAVKKKFKKKFISKKNHPKANKKITEISYFF